MNLVSILATVVIARGLTNRLIYVFPLFGENHVHRAAWLVAIEQFTELPRYHN